MEIGNFQCGGLGSFCTDPLTVNNHWTDLFALKILLMAYNKILLPIHELYRNFLTWHPPFNPLPTDDAIWRHQILAACY